jgi:hypothetical protein
MAWGARAIYKLESITTKRTRKVAGKVQRYNATMTEVTIDVLADRQQVVGGTPEEQQAMCSYINRRVIAQLRKQCRDKYLVGDSEETLCFVEGGYTVTASPRASYGYLYICVSK